MSILARLFNFVAATPAVADNVDAEFDTIVSYVNTNAIVKDGTLAFTNPVEGVVPTAVGHLVRKDYCDGNASAGLPAGFVSMYGSTTPPAGWLLCDGAGVSRTIYANLFAVIGTTYGAGSGGITFNVPDLRARFPIGTNPLAIDSWRPARAMGAASGRSVQTKGALVNGGAPGTAGYGVINFDDDNMPPYVALQFIIKT